MTADLKQSTAETIVFGPFVDSTDGSTAKTALSIAQADIRLSKGGSAFAQTNNAAGATHMENGHYSVPLNTTDTATLGRLRVAILKSGALPVWRDFMVLPANVWDSLYGADRLQVDVEEIGNNLITAAVIADGAIDAATFAANAITAASIATDAITNAKIAADAIGASELAADAVTEIQSGLATATALATVAGYVDTEVAAILAAVDTEVATLVTNVATILAKTNNLPSDPADASDIATATNAISAAIAALNNLSAAQVNAEIDTALADYDAPTKAELDSAVAPLATQSNLNSVGSAVATVAGYIDTEVAAILAAVDTEIATLITNVAAILADTGTDGVALSTATMQAIADAVLIRSVTNTQDDASRTNLTQVILAMFESDIDPDGVVTINKTTGSLYTTKQATLDPDAVPITGMT